METNETGMSDASDRDSLFDAPTPGEVIITDDEKVTEVSGTQQSTPQVC